MQSWKVKPSKPAAILGMVVGIAILVAGIAMSHRFTPFLILWVIVGLAVIGFNLWAAFSPRGSTYNMTSMPNDPGV